MRRRNSSAIATTNNDAWGFSNNLYGRFFFCILFSIRWPEVLHPIELWSGVFSPVIWIRIAMRAVEGCSSLRDLKLSDVFIC